MVEITKNEEVEFPLNAADLEDGQFAQDEHGTVVVKLSELTFHQINIRLTDEQRVINIESGIGGFGESSRFRRLYNTSIKITTGDKAVSACK